MEKITGDEPAYATDHVITDSHGNIEGIESKRWSGLTIRQEFAARAMQGLLSGHDYVKMENCAKDAVKQADALIAELNK